MPFEFFQERRTAVGLFMQHNYLTFHRPVQQMQELELRCFTPPMYDEDSTYRWAFLLLTINRMAAHLDHSFV